MAYRVLYRIYRPHQFKDVVGQDVIVKTLQNAICQNHVANAYLFCGPRGTGKTSVAKIFANAVNCTHFNNEPCGQCDNCVSALSNNHPDIIEFDAASYSRVDSIREVLKNVSYAPTMGKYKVYIIDEVHMLSNSAASALLKTLEEPPSHVIFILATTDPQKVLPTIQSRCQRYDFGKINAVTLVKKMASILDEEKVQYETPALELIASLSEGGMRDALSLLEQCLAYCEDSLKEEDVKKIYGLTTKQEQISILSNVHQQNLSSAIEKVREMYANGMDIRKLTEDLIDDCKEAILYADGSNQKLLEHLSVNEAIYMLEFAHPNTLLKDIDCLFETFSRGKVSIDPLAPLELALMKMSTSDVQKQTEAVKSVEIKTIPTTKTEKPLPGSEKKEFQQPVRSFSEPEEPSLPVTNQEDDSMPIPQDIPEDYLPYEPVEESVGNSICDYSGKELLSVLLNASKEEKIKDEDVFTNLLDNYQFGQERKFYLALKEVKIFASSPDFILFSNPNNIPSEINDLDFNKQLYFFLSEEMGIDKMCYLLNSEETANIVSLYKRHEYPEAKDLHIDRYQKEIKTTRKQTKEEQLRELFGNIVKVED